MFKLGSNMMAEVMLGAFVVFSWLALRDRAASALAAMVLLTSLLANTAGALVAFAATWVTPLVCLAAYARLGAGTQWFHALRARVRILACAWLPLPLCSILDRAMDLAGALPTLIYNAGAAMGLGPAIDTVVGWVEAILQKCGSGGNGSATQGTGGGNVRHHSRPPITLDQIVGNITQLAACVSPNEMGGNTDANVEPADKAHDD